jgi:hypothetical protein
MSAVGSKDGGHAAQRWAVYYSVEETVAKELAAAGEVTIIVPPNIPKFFRVNNVGQPALCVVDIPGDKLAIFHQALAEAYSR